MITIVQAVLLLHLGLIPLFGQTASLRGTVTDESGAVVPGANVTLTGSGSGAKRARTNGEGVYSISGLNPGEYMVQAAAPGLALPEPAKISVTTGVVTLNLELKIAAKRSR